MISKGLRLGQKTKFGMDMQALTGVQFDREAGEKLYAQIIKEMEEIAGAVEPDMPLITTVKSKQKTFPKRKFRTVKGAIEPSADVIKCCEAYGFKLVCNEEDVWCVRLLDGLYHDLTQVAPDYIVNPQARFEMKNQKELKEYLLIQGWKPYFWNYKKGPDGKEVREKINGKWDRVKTSPKFHDKGDLCPGLEALGDKVGNIAQIVKWVMLRHRRGILRSDKGTGWLCDERLDIDGRIGARSGGLTNTHRQKHRGICNVPRPSTALGKELRSLLTVRDGMVAVGYDASSLEDVVKGHYAFRYDGGDYANKVNDPDYDAHQETADAWGLATRQEAKPGNYGLQYNQGAPGLAETYGVDISTAEEWHRKYWELNWGWRDCLKDLETAWECKYHKKGFICPVSGIFLHSRNKNSLGSLLVQHTGAFIMDWAGAVMDSKLGGIQFDDEGRPGYYYKGHWVYRVIYYHDEYMYECPPEIAQEILDLGIQSIILAGKQLKLKVPLGADGSIGKNWAEVH